MPTSNPASIPTIVSVIYNLAPASVLDVGVGNGKYGFLLREYLELWGDDHSHRRIDGIEAHEPYIGAVQRAVYDDIYIGDALTVLPTLNQHYDVALAADILEHFTEADGKRLLYLLAQHATYIVIATPDHEAPQGACFGNEYERHRRQWTLGDIAAELPSTQIVTCEGGTLITISRGN